MPELVMPTPRLRTSWLASRDEWGRGAHQSNADLADEDDVDSCEGFRAWTERLQLGSDPVEARPGRVPATNWWIVEGDAYLGSIQMRHYLNDFLLEAGGHIGYGIRPSACGRGYATWALGAVLPSARELGLARVLLTCDDDNVASARVIEKNGGVLEDVRTTSAGRKRRYWITF